MRSFGSKPGIPAPVNVADPVARKSFVAIKEAIENLFYEVEMLKQQLDPKNNPPKPQTNALPQPLPRPPVNRDPSPMDTCGND